MSSRRRARLNEQMKREISEILRTEVRDPRIGLPTITDVEVTPDLWSAKVYVRPDPTQEAGESEELLLGLETAAPFIRKELGKSLQLRRVPELRFQPDHTLDQALRIERILRDVLPPGSEDQDDPLAEGEGPENEEGGRR